MRTLVRMKDVSYRYPERKGWVLKGIDLVIREGEFVLLLGPSGCGKSTLLRAMNGAVPHLYGGAITGKVTVLGENIREVPPKQLAGRVGMVFQDPEAQLVMTSPENEIKFGLDNIGFSRESAKRRVEETLQMINMETDEKSRFTPELSGGEKQKLALGSVVAMDPELLLLDEPTSQLDPKSAEEILGLLRKFNEERGLTVVLVEHRLERCMQFADRVVRMDSGRIVADLPTADYIEYTGGEKLKNGEEEKGVFLPPVSRIGWEGGGKTPRTVKEARREVYKGLKEGRLVGTSPSAPIRRGKTLISLRGVVFGYNGGKRVLDGIDLRIRAGDQIALLGRNGAGKSTLLKLLNGLLKPVRGKVVVNGFSTSDLPTSLLARVCGYLSQSPSDYLYQRTVGEEIMLGVEEPGGKRSGERTGGRAVEQVGKRAGGWMGERELFERIVVPLNLERYLDLYPRDLSVGERERVALASVLAMEPPVLALDEPTRGMDYGDKARLAKILNERAEKNMASVVATHDVEFVTDYADRVVVLGDKRILARDVPKKVLPASFLFAPQTNLATRGFEEYGLKGNMIRPDELVWVSTGERGKKGKREPGTRESGNGKCGGGNGESSKNPVACRDRSPKGRETR